MTFLFELSKQNLKLQKRCRVLLPILMKKFASTRKCSFQQYLESVKKNTKVISEDVLKKIQSHLKGTTRGDKAVRRKVKKHSFFLMNYGSAVDVVCVNKRVKGQSTKKTNTIKHD